jgi:2-methylisocitrate lyase-like PEP mutase family enzyme
MTLMYDHFASLHAPGTPLVLFNAWDAGSALAIERSGAKAIATSSWAVAAALGFEDGESLPLDWLERITRRIAKSISVPLTVDIETGYSEDPAEVADHALRIRNTGAVGINIEDRDRKTASPVPLAKHVLKLRAISSAQTSEGEPLFINARSDVFFDPEDPSHPTERMGHAVERAHAYVDAGADGIFFPGLKDPDLVARLVEEIGAPINVMVPDVEQLKIMKQAGARRISFGPAPYLSAMEMLTTCSREALTL